MLRTLEYIVLAVCVAAIIIFSFWLGHQAYSWMPIQASTDAQQVDALFSFLVTLSSIIFLGVTGLQAYSLITCRAREGDYSEGHPARGSWKIESLWMGIPVLLVLWIASYGFNVYERMDIMGPTKVLALDVPMAAEPAEAATVNNDAQAVEKIDVISKQWSWTFRYPDKNVTSSELHLPVNRPVRLLLQSEDVLHGFYVPEFRTKQDIIPNRPIQFQLVPIRVGKYQLHDSQFSGTYFALMDANVYVDSAEDYANWLQKAATQEPAKATNRAASEHTQPPKRAIRSNWYTVLPAEPPVVNHSS